MADKPNIQMLKKFILKDKRDRILFELESEKKRQKAFSKMSDFDFCFRRELISADLSHKTDDEAKNALLSLFGDADAFDLATMRVEKLLLAFQRAVDSYMNDVLIVGEDNIVYVGEAEYGASEKCVLSWNG